MLSLRENRLTDLESCAVPAFRRLNVSTDRAWRGTVSLKVRGIVGNTVIVKRVRLPPDRAGRTCESERHASTRHDNTLDV